VNHVPNAVISWRLKKGVKSAMDVDIACVVDIQNLLRQIIW